MTEHAERQITDKKPIRPYVLLGAGFLLTLILAVTKIGGLHDWSWWLVVLPLFIPASVVLFGAFCMFVALCVLVLTIHHHDSNPRD